MWAVMTILLLAALTWTLIDRPDPPPSAPLSRGLLVLPENVTTNDVMPPNARLAVSPDGTRLIFQGRHLTTGQAQLFLMALDGSTATPLSQTREVASQWWTPDSRSVMVSSRGGLARLPLDGTPPVTLGTKVPGGPAGTAMNANGQLLVGGETLRLMQLKDFATETLFEKPGGGFFRPSFLADGQRFLVSVVEADGFDLDRGRQTGIQGAQHVDHGQ